MCTHSREINCKNEQQTAPRKRICPGEGAIEKTGSFSYAGGCGMPRTRGSGNASWQAAAVKYRFKRGRPGFRKCAALKRNGQPCGNLAMRSTSVCQCHGGRMLIARLRRREKAYGYRSFRVVVGQLQDSEGRVPRKLWRSNSRRRR